MRTHDEHEDAGALRSRFGLLAIVFTACFVVLLGRLFYVQIVRGDEYREAARTSFTTTERLPARRGEVKDRTGVLLAKNVPVRRLRLAPDKLLKPAVQAEVMTRLGAILEFTHEEEAAIVDKLALAHEGNRSEPILVSEQLVDDQCPFDGATLELPTDPPPDVDAEHLLFCRECGLYHEPIAADATFCPHDRSRLTWTGDGAQRQATCPKCKRHFATSGICPIDGQIMSATQHNLVCPVCKRRFTNQVAVLESQGDLAGVMVDTTLMREYTQPFTLAHTLGYINRVTQKDLDLNPGVYPIDGRKGRAGIESALEAILRGKSGGVEYLMGTNRTVENSRRPSEPGFDVWLTIDARLQREVRDIMRYQRSGAAVVMEPNTGEILALYSHPGFDPNAWSGRLSKEEWTSISQNPYDPLHNKAVTAYAPGSVYKIVTALAGLREHIITPETTYFCPGHYEYGGRDFGCHLKTGHGTVNLHSAMKGSCDVYFYKVAEQLGMDRLAKYGREFGFGAPTGIEIAESIGIVPTRKWYDDTTPLKFQPGLTLSVGIGQGSLTATPLQVARSFAVMANGGRLVQPRLVMRYTDESRREEQEFLPVDERRVAMTPDEHAFIEDGLLAVVNDPGGTGKAAYDDLLKVAGKTGTAEAPQSRIGATPEIATWLKEDHAWFAMYAPVPDPQVVIVIFLEHGGSGGHDAGPLARRVFEAWKRLGLYRAPPPELEPLPGEDPGGPDDSVPDDGAPDDAQPLRPGTPTTPTDHHLAPGGTP